LIGEELDNNPWAGRLSANGNVEVDTGTDGGRHGLGVGGGEVYS